MTSPIGQDICRCTVCDDPLVLEGSGSVVVGRNLPAGDTSVRCDRCDTHFVLTVQRSSVQDPLIHLFVLVAAFLIGIVVFAVIK